jgi:HlyD family secretion protein
MSKKIVWIGIAVLAVGAAAYPFVRKEKVEPTEYQFTTVTRGLVQSAVSSTGTIQAVGTINVGTQVSGTVSAIFCDFNDHVRKGQRLAVLDTMVLAASVRDAEANLERAEAQMKQAVAEFDRMKPLQEKGFLSPLEFLPMETNLTIARSSVVSARSTLERARTNLGYSTIVAPIDGTIIERRVDAGQTVAASFNTPTLFIIAEDLSKMQIFATVDESDIGQIRLGQKVNFTVQAFPDEEFHGSVQQIRLQPTTIQNVVSYTVVIDAVNEKGILMPGMTATIDFVTDEVDDVLRVLNGALRYEPNADMLTKLGIERMSGRYKRGSKSNGPDSSSGRDLPGDGHHNPDEGMGRGRLWTQDETGKLSFIMVETGLSDGKITEIHGGDDLSEGMLVISGAAKQSTADQKNVVLFRGIRPGRGIH